MDQFRYGHYNELVEVGRAYLEGKTSRGIFEETANRVLASIREGMRQFQQIQLPPQRREALRETIRKAQKGFILFEEGVVKMKKAVDEEEKKEEIFWQGICLAKFGCDLLNEAMKGHEDPGAGESEN